MTDTTQTVLLVKQNYGIDVGRVLAMRAAVEEVIEKVLREPEHFGALPGTQGKDGKKPKKMLFQPGAEVLCQVFRVRPEYKELSVVERDDFISIKIMCRLFNSVTGEQVGEAIGSTNSREDKYASQVAAKLCPTCGAPTIFRSKDGGWFCWAKKGGCGATFADEDKKLLDQTGTVSVQRLYSLYHTLESIAQKRAFVKATRSFTATSDIFTDEDVPPEDNDHGQPGATAHGQRTQTKPAAGQKILATDVLKLNEALRTAELLPADLEKMPKAEQDPAIRKLWLDWVNGMLEDAGKPKVASMMEIPQDMVETLLKAAKEKRAPRGW
jgi:ribosomal protein L37AE/L43A